MRKRVLKPGDTHLMSPDEEYCRLVYQRQPNNTFDVSVEVYDVDGVTHTSEHKRLSQEAIAEVLQDILGNDWETIFAQDYSDWAIYCRKRPRQFSVQRLTAAPKSPISRNAIVGAVAVCAALLVFGWLAGQISTSRNQPASLPDESTNAVEPEDRADSGVSQSSDTAASSDADEARADSDSETENARTDDASSDASAVTIDTGEANASETVAAIALQSDTNPFERAVQIAQETVLEGRVANTQEEWEAIAERWQQAAELMGEVSAEDERYDIAQDRIESYENNRDAALSEAEKF